LIVTAHRRGRLATLVACATSVGLLDRIMQRLAPEGLVTAPSAAELFVRHRGNLRDALRELYDVYAASPDPEAAQPTPAAPRTRPSPRLRDKAPDTAGPTG
jgi:hypothetical protein